MQVCAETHQEPKDIPNPTAFPSLILGSSFHKDTEICSRNLEDYENRPQGNLRPR